MVTQKYEIATLGSHSALQILHGAKKEGFKTLLITTPAKASLYRRYDFINEIKEIPTFADFPTVEEELASQNVIIIPHGSFVAYLGEEANKNMKLPYFGNKAILEWEGDREKQFTWLKESDLTLPQTYTDIKNVKYPIIVKTFGAAGGAGYFLATDDKELEEGIKTFKDKKYTIQEYIIGVPLYVHYFYSPLTGKLEVMSMDRRYETNVDGIGRIPAFDQTHLGTHPSYVVVGNIPLVIRESLLEECYKMAERVIESSKKLIDKKGLFGPFCLETVITPDQKIYVIEISTRIVAGTNLFTSGSPYSDLFYDEPMSTGRRIAREIKNAIEQNKLQKILD